MLSLESENSLVVFTTRGFPPSQSPALELSPVKKLENNIVPFGLDEILQTATPKGRLLVHAGRTVGENKTQTKRFYRQSNNEPPVCHPSDQFSIGAPKILLLYGYHDPVGTEWVRCHDGGHKIVVVVGFYWALTIGSTRVLCNTVGAALGVKVDTRGHKNCARQNLKTLISQLSPDAAIL